MTVRILFIHKLVVINKIVIPCIIRRIDINHINLTLVSIGKSSKGFKVVSLDKDMIGGIGFGADESF